MWHITNEDSPTAGRKREEWFGPAGASTAQVTTTDLRHLVSMMHGTK